VTDSQGNLPIEIWLVNKDNKLEQHPLTVLREEDKFLFVAADMTLSHRLLLSQPDFPQVGMEVKIAGSLTSNVAKHD